MNIKGRLKTIEGKMKINDSPFCACESYKGNGYPRCEIVYERKGVQTIDNPIPDTCERCRKPIEKERIIIRFVDSRKELISE